MEGKCWKFGDDVNTDEIIPARYLNMTDEKELAAHCMEGIDEDFPRKARAGEIIVGGRNFGCGSSREHAPLCIRAFGIPCVVAESFARIFFRNAINIGLRIAECPEAARDAEMGDVLEVDFALGRIVNRTKGRTYGFSPFTAELQAIIDAGGLIPHAKKTAARN
jgi:3-isopropylmalate/(R)-2-methylmalate dehydratase small subunit